MATDPWAEILAQISQMKASPVDLRASMQSNPNDPNPGSGSGGTNLAWGNVPGLEQFYSYDAQNNQENFNLAAALPEIERLGYQVMQGFNPAGEASGTWVVGPDGKPIAQSAYLTGTNDDNFKIASQLASALVGNAVGGWAAAGNNTMGGAASGGIDSLIGGGTDVILDAAGNPVPLNMAAIESGLGTPGYGFNEAAFRSEMFDPSVIGSGAGLMYGPGGAIIPYDPAAVSAMTANDAIKPVSTKPTSEWTDAEWDEYLNSSDSNLNAPTNAPVTSETVDVTAQRIPPVNAGGAIGAGIGATLPNYGNEGNNYPPSTNNPDYGNEGKNYPTPESTQGPGGSPVNAGPTPDWSSSIKDWVLKNPKLAMTLAGSLLGGAGGSSTPAPAAPGTGPQAGFTATPAPSLGRQYVAPPPGYRPGFDPEHRYFTGIGTVGTGG